MEKGQEFKVSPTEKEIQRLLAELMGIEDEAERAKIQEKIEELRKSGEGRADLQRQEEMVRRGSGQPEINSTGWERK